ncbi:MAG: hypothetical protein OXF55_16340 [Caldilineaceae bacterium]|nr:hypothetical protein [Caldilineaceae bacterium]
MAVLVMFDEVVIGVAGEGQRIEPECVRRWQPQKTQTGIRSPEMRQIEIDQVVT